MAAPAPIKRRWRKYLVNARYQGKYIFWATASSGLLALTNLIMIRGFITDNVLSTFDAAAVPDGLHQVVSRDFDRVMTILWAFSLFFILITAVMSLIISHKTAGPLFNFRRVFKEVESGKLESRIRLRPADDFQEVAESFNRMMDSVEARLASGASPLRDGSDEVPTRG